MRMTAKPWTRSSTWRLRAAPGGDCRRCSARRRPPPAAGSPGGTRTGCGPGSAVRQELRQRPPVPPSVSAQVSGLRSRRPDKRLGDYDALTVEGDGGTSVQFVAKIQNLAHAPAERGVVRTGQDSVDGQPVWWCAHDQDRRHGRRSELRGEGRYELRFPQSLPAMRTVRCPPSARERPSRNPGLKSGQSQNTKPRYPKAK